MGDDQPAARSDEVVRFIHAYLDRTEAAGGEPSLRELKRYALKAPNAPKPFTWDAVFYQLVDDRRRAQK